MWTEAANFIFAMKLYCRRRTNVQIFANEPVYNEPPLALISLQPVRESEYWAPKHHRAIFSMDHIRMKGNAKRKSNKISHGLEHNNKITQVWCLNINTILPRLETTKKFMLSDILSGATPNLVHLFCSEFVSKEDELAHVSSDFIRLPMWSPTFHTYAVKRPCLGKSWASVF